MGEGLILVSAQACTWLYDFTHLSLSDETQFIHYKPQ